jgi:hypothetical protein
MDVVIAVLLGIIVLQLGWIRMRIDKVNEHLQKK